MVDVRIGVRIGVGGRDSDVESLGDWLGRERESLWDWLRSERELRGHLRQGQAPGPEGAMGALAEVIVGVASSGAATALAKAMQVWLVQRRADVVLNISGPDGKQIMLDAKRVPDAEHLLNYVLGWTDDVPPVPPMADTDDVPHAPPMAD
jgi:Effector Associated Constant Component 1